MEKQYLEEMQDKITELIQSGRLTDKRLIVFGHTEAAEKMIDEFLLDGIVPASIADNNPAKAGGNYRKVPIKRPVDAFEPSEKETVVLIASRAFESMREQCINMGYTDVIKVVDYNTFSAFSLADDVLEEKMERLFRGLDILDLLRTQYPNHYIAICPYNALGDVYQALRYFPLYRKKKGIDLYVLVVNGKGACDIAEMFGVKNVCEADKAQMEELQQAVIYKQYKDVQILHHDRPFYTNVMIRLADRHQLTFDDMYRIGLYELSEKEMGDIPKRSERVDFPELVKGRSVIIAPYARSVIAMPEGFWEYKVAELLEKGLEVYTNIVGDEKPLAGTREVSYPVKDMINAVEYAGYFVGIRSGLCDVIQSAECRKEIVYPECIYSTTDRTVKEFFKMTEGAIGIDLTSG